MNKSILVINTPENCYDCGIRSGYMCGGVSGICGIGKTLPENLIKPEWCPLKPLEEIGEPLDEYGNTLRPCVINIGEETEIYRTIQSEEFQTRVIREAETYKGHFHRWFERKIGGLHELLAVVEYEDGTIHFVYPNDITFTDRVITERVNIKQDKDLIAEGDICEFGKNEKVFVYVSLGRGNPNSDGCVEGFYLTGKNRGHIGRFYLKELRKTDKHFDIDNILKNVCAE